MSQLLKGWVEAKLGDYLHLKNGFAFKSKDYVSASEGTVPVIRISDINGSTSSDERANHVLVEKVVSEFEIAEGDLLVAMSGATTGKIGVYIGNTPAYQNQRVGSLKLNASSLSSIGFRNHLIKYLSPTILKIAYGGAQPNISASGIENINIGIPPLAEQNRIVEKLDEVLAQVDTIKARLDDIPAILKRFRQSVLTAAVSGKLTEEWRGTDELVDWQVIKLGSIVHAIEAGKNLKCIEIPPENDDHGIIKISAVTWGVYDEEQSKTLPSEDLFIESRRINVGDFLISRANTIELLGNPVIVHQVTKNLMLSDKVLRLVMREEDKPWVSIFLRSTNGRHEIESRSTGNQMSMRNIGQKALLDIDIPKAPDTEQKEIVRLVDQYFSFADTIEAQVKKAQKRVDNLTQSILAKAFRGELVPQDPNDEPADKLLKRIAQARIEAEALAKAAKKSEADKKRAAKKASA